MGRLSKHATARLDYLVHRCGACGSWLYATRPCMTCVEAAR